MIALIVGGFLLVALELGWAAEALARGESMGAAFLMMCTMWLFRVIWCQMEDWAWDYRYIRYRWPLDAQGQFSPERYFR